MFSEELAKYDWEETTRQIQHKRPADVETALGKEHLTLDDFMALISPAAAAYLEPMARLSRRYTQERFGKTISMYIPMYITNSCTNSCIYCGFNHHNKFDRVILTMEQIEDECKAIRALGPFENLLLVTGENPRAAGVDYIEQTLKVCRPYFNNLTIEVMPLASEDYYRLTQSGLNGVVCFQETYNRANYNIYHPAGMKSKFEWRVNGFDRMGQAGVHKIGMGVLIGLEEWRTDVTMMALHLQYQIEDECKAIRALGPFENLLLVTGENPRAAGVDYIEQTLKVCRPYFNNLTIEVMPLASEDYYRLTQSGLNGVVCFQETYNRANYNIYHPAGMKSKFEWRVNGFDRMGQAGVHKIGMGVLIGLEEWRTDVTMMALHLQYLRKHYWKTRYSVNFPRMCPSEGHFQPNVVMTDRELAQLTFAFRIFDHDVDISFSTREKPSFRNHIATLGATSMSAGSKTDPGGYHTYPQSLEQFSVSDERTPAQVEADIRREGYEVVWKDWDKIFD